MKVAVGSTNPLKVRAVKNVMKKIYGDVEVIPIRVPSKVSHTPLTDEECVKGAINRAKAAIEKTNADLGIGLEGGVIRRVGRYFVTGWCAVVDRNGEVALGYSGGVELPEKVVRAVLEGRELGDVMDEFVGIRNVKKKMGAIGILTNGLSNRRKATEEVIIYAMAKRLRPELYK
ncbi:MAG: inosine/xanthosine triphosphatase [Thermoproteota archaeon]|jgi:inosine/xanthosine triphosphatase